MTFRKLQFLLRWHLWILGSKRFEAITSPSTLNCWANSTKCSHISTNYLNSMYVFLLKLLNVMINSNWLGYQTAANDEKAARLKENSRRMQVILQQALPTLGYRLEGEISNFYLPWSAQAYVNHVAHTELKESQKIQDPALLADMVAEFSKSAEVKRSLESVQYKYVLMWQLLGIRLTIGSGFGGLCFSLWALLWEWLFSSTLNRRGAQGRLLDFARRTGYYY